SNLENYREEEDSLRSALIGAQKLGDSILKESRQKAEKIVQDATTRAEQISSDASLKIEQQRYELEQMQAEVSEFKERLFSLYKAHLDMLKNIPSEFDAKNKSKNSRAPHAPLEVELTRNDEPSDSAEDTDNRQYDYSESSEACVQDYPQQEEEHAEEAVPEESAPAEQYCEPDDDFFDSPFIVDAPDSDKFLTDIEPEPVAPIIDNQQMSTDDNDDVPIYDIPPRRTEREGFAPKVSHPAEKPHENPFTTPPMVQLEFDIDGYDDDDDFAEEKELLREANLNRIPYLDDDDDDGFAVQINSKKKPVISQKFGVLKFGDAFDLRED
ncbi:MAG: DivIVA domain-containing protein, partial [Angelakisella sp.]